MSISPTWYMYLINGAISALDTIKRNLGKMSYSMKKQAAYQKVEELESILNDLKKEIQRD